MNVHGQRFWQKLPPGRQKLPPHRRTGPATGSPSNAQRSIPCRGCRRQPLQEPKLLRLWRAGRGQRHARPGSHQLPHRRGHRQGPTGHPVQLLRIHLPHEEQLRRRRGTAPHGGRVPPGRRPAAPNRPTSTMALHRQRESHKNLNLAIGKFETACGLQLLPRRFQLDLLFVSAD